MQSKSEMKRLAIQKASKKKPYPHWVCQGCGIKASKGKSFTISTFHVNICEVCEQEKSVTEARDFYYPDFKGHERS